MQKNGNRIKGHFIINTLKFADNHIFIDQNKYDIKYK